MRLETNVLVSKLYYKHNTGYIPTHMPIVTQFGNVFGKLNWIYREMTR